MGISKLTILFAVATALLASGCASPTATPQSAASVARAVAGTNAVFLATEEPTILTPRPRARQALRQPKPNL